MFFLSSLFFFSLLLSFLMILFRIWELENRKIPLPVQEQFSRRAHTFEEWEKKVWEEGKRFALRVVALSLKLIVLGIDKTRKSMRRLIIKTEESLVKKRTTGISQGASSFFLKDISEHKRRMRIKKEK
jgi:hypothetical protein